VTTTTQRRRCIRCEDGVQHDWKHGSLSGYRYHRCRCAECKRFMREYSVNRYWNNRDAVLDQKRRQRERNLDAYRDRERSKSRKPETKATQKRRQERMSRVPVTRLRNWLPHEKELVSRLDLSVMELAYMLRRSPRSIQAQRDWLRDPSKIRDRNNQWRRDNYDRLIEARRARFGNTPRGQRTHCKRGHAYDDENTYLYQDRRGKWHRYCKSCRKKPPVPRRTRCPQGHEYSTDNTYIYGNGYRKCRACDRERHRYAKTEAAS